MPNITTSRMLRPHLPSTQTEYVLSFLAPSVQFARAAPRISVAQFSTSLALSKRDNNRNRGISVLRHTGLRPRQTLSVKKKHDFELPRPVVIEEKIQGDEDHGLWAFFPEDRRLLMTPTEESQHGKPWTVAALETHMELEQWDEDDLHSMWWTCIKERNRLATEKLERARVNAGYGDHENQQRDEAVQKTMKAILDLREKRRMQPANQEEEELLEDYPYSDIPAEEMLEDEPQAPQQQYIQAKKVEDNANTREETPRKSTYVEGEDQRIKKVLWNK